MEKVAVGLRQVLDQELGLGLLSLQRRDVGNRFDDMSAAVGRVDFGPLNEEVFIAFGSGTSLAVGSPVSTASGILQN
jgi:hypothetical protein